MKKLAVIILNWNGLELLKKFLPAASCFTRGEGVKLIVADNGSKDGSIEWVTKNHPEVEIIAFDRNWGFAEGYNKAIARSGYEYTVLLNSDVEVTEGWWEPLLDYMEKHEDTAAVQPKIKSYSNKKMFEYAGAAGGYLDKLGFPFCRGRIFDKIEEDKGQYDASPMEITWASGACLMVRTADYINVGGLDPYFFAHMEEIDLCCRLLRTGKKILFIPYSEVYHVGGASLPQGNPQKTYLNFRNNLLLLHKNLPISKGKRLLLARRLVDTLIFFLFIFIGDFKNSKSIIKAHNDFRKMKKRYPELPKQDFMPRKGFVFIERLKKGFS